MTDLVYTGAAPAIPLDRSDVQALVVRGYAELPACTYLLLQITDPAAFRGWLATALDRLGWANDKPLVATANLAFTCDGLRRLESDAGFIDQFSVEFRQGMVEEHRSRLFGDVDDSAPEHWHWGGPATPAVHALLMVYASDDPTLQARLTQWRAGLTGAQELTALDTAMLPDNREHFGFVDSIGQPFIEEFSSGTAIHDRAVALGEILLGYPNGYGRYTRRPLLDPQLDPQGHLAPDPEGSANLDFGLNGTYLVFRQLGQDVPGFWNWLRNESGDDPDAVALASKLVGRWPSGASLVRSPENDPGSSADMDEFEYHALDAGGQRCPLGAHIRRTHPRDSLEPGRGTDESRAFSDRHRLLRRGRSYGAPLHPDATPAQMLARLAEGIPDAEQKTPRGLHFVCLNASIGRQFEFVQVSWLNNPHFDGREREPDPLVGAREVFGETQDIFTVQQSPARRRLCGLPRFVSVRGGAYFFLPSRRALSWLARVNAAA